MPLDASVSDLKIGLAWVQILKPVDYNAWCGNFRKAPFTNWRWRNVKL
jgi:hypothetical protein